MKKITSYGEGSEKLKKVDYPKLMRSEANGTIVLFCAEGCGTLVANPYSNWKIGDYSESWNTVVFDDYDGPVILEMK